jgi:phosphatidylserine/phosphatidylglycerophosphate/cardiolipin synthase-like enzyme
MRTRSKRVGGYQVSAVAGTNTVSFAIDADPGVTKGLLGFAVEREDPTENERYFVYGFKVFGSVIEKPTEDTVVTTFDQPVQSLVWDDFTAKPGREYTYWFHPLKGKPKNLDRTAPPVPVTVRTEQLFTDGAHDIFFNRGVASSQAYQRRFGNRRPDMILPLSLRQEAFDWLSRDLKEALLQFIDSAEAGDGLLGCFYEFSYRPVADALRKAVERGVDVRLIVDAKENGSPARPASPGKKARDAIEAFPREENRRMLADSAFPMDRVTLREARPDQLQHNKFMVRLSGTQRNPAEVWTGSTNISEGGIFGQANVGHWVRDPGVADAFRRYWELLREDPGAKADGVDARKKNAAFRKAVEDLASAPTAPGDIVPGTTAVFSPRSGSAVLELYSTLFDQADDLSCITLAFGIGERFKTALQDNTQDSHLAFVLLERRDVPRKGSKQPFIELDRFNNVYEAWGSFLRTPLHQWARETSTLALGLNTHVMFIHTKFLLVDPLGPDPIVVTGSANFSDASTNDNDENMLVIRGDRRVADIYFTEFNRLFNHYYFRSVREATKGLTAEEARAADLQTLFLAEDDEWLKKYGPRSLRTKRARAVTGMAVDP